METIFWDDNFKNKGAGSSRDSKIHCQSVAVSQHHRHLSHIYKHSYRQNSLLMTNLTDRAVYLWPLLQIGEVYLCPLLQTGQSIYDHSYSHGCLFMTTLTDRTVFLKTRSSTHSDIAPSMTQDAHECFFLVASTAPASTPWFCFTICKGMDSAALCRPVIRGRQRVQISPGQAQVGPMLSQVSTGQGTVQTDFCATFTIIVSCHSCFVFWCNVHALWLKMIYHKVFRFVALMIVPPLLNLLI